MSPSNEHMPESQTPQPHLRVTLERHARRAALAAVVALGFVTAMQWVDLQRDASTAYNAAHEAWLAGSAENGRLDTLLQSCMHGTPRTHQEFRDDQMPLTNVDCEFWVASQARRRWGQDSTSNLRALADAQEHAVLAVFNARPAPLRYFN